MGCLKAVDTVGICQRLAFTVGVSQHMHNNKNCENLSSIGHRTCEISMKEKIPLSLEVVCVKIVYFETSSSKLEVLKLNSWKITSFSKTMSLHREPFLTMF